MMAVVVHNHYFRALKFDLKAAAGPPERLQPLGDVREGRPEFGADNIPKLVIGRIGHAVGDGVGERVAQPRRVSIIAAINDLTAGLRDELAEYFNDSCEAGIEIEVFLFD